MNSLLFVGIMASLTVFYSGKKKVEGGGNKGKNDLIRLL